VTSLRDELELRKLQEEERVQRELATLNEEARVLRETVIRLRDDLQCKADAGERPAADGNPSDR
jgi:hypothetical protein